MQYYRKSRTTVAVKHSYKLYCNLHYLYNLPASYQLRSFSHSQSRTLGFIDVLTGCTRNVSNENPGECCLSYLRLGVCTSRSLIYKTTTTTTTTTSLIEMLPVADWAVIAAHLSLTIAVGIYIAVRWRKQSSTEVRIMQRFLLPVQ